MITFVQSQYSIIMVERVQGCSTACRSAVLQAAAARRIAAASLRAPGSDAQDCTMASAKSAGTDSGVVGLRAGEAHVLELWP